MREVVKDVALNFPTAIVTGRSIDKVHYILPNFDINYILYIYDEVYININYVK